MTDTHDTSVPADDAADDPTSDAAARPTGVAADAGSEEESKRTLRPDWWHRDHPVFGPLSGFYTGMLFVIVVPGLYGALLKSVVGYQRAEELFPFVLLTFVVPLALLVPPQTRRFARYMLFGAIATAIVVLGVALAVLWFLVKRAA